MGSYEIVSLSDIPEAGKAKKSEKRVYAERLLNDFRKVPKDSAMQVTEDHNGKPLGSATATTIANSIRIEARAMRIPAKVNQRGDKVFISHK